jgi:hypothetical protein
MAKKIATHTITALPQVKREIWELGRRPLNVTVTELRRQGEQSEILLAVQGGARGGVIGYELVSSTAPMSALADFAQRAMRQPLLGRPRRPQAVRVASQAEAEVLLEPLARDGVWIEVSAPLTTLDDLHHALQEAMGGLAGGYRVLAAQAGEPLDDDTLREFFRVARAFYRAELWTDFGGEVFFEIELQPAEGPPKTWYGILLGNMGEEFGLALYGSLEDLRRFHEVGERHEDRLATPPMTKRRRPEPSELPSEASMMADILSVPCLGLTFTPQADVLPPLIEEAKVLKLPVANKSAFPLLLKTGHGRMQVAQGGDLQAMLLAMRAILDWDRQITRMNVDDELDVTIASTLSARDGTLPQITARTTLRLNPYVPEDEDDADMLPVELSDLLQAFLDSLPPPKEQSRAKSSKTAASKIKHPTEVTLQSRGGGSGHKRGKGS